MFYRIRNKVTGEVFDQLEFHTEEAAWRKIGLEAEPENYDVISG